MQEVASKLSSLAVKRGSQDNIGVVRLRIGGGLCASLVLVMWLGLVADRATNAEGFRQRWACLAPLCCPADSN